MKINKERSFVIVERNVFANIRRDRENIAKDVAITRISSSGFESKLALSVSRTSVRFIPKDNIDFAFEKKTERLFVGNVQVLLYIVIGEFLERFDSSSYKTSVSKEEVVNGLV